MDIGTKEYVQDIDIIKFAKLREEAIIPSKREEDMCYDIYPCFQEEYIVIRPHTTRLIPTGICSAFSSKYGISLRERGSNGSKGIKVSAGQIDSGFRGEWFVAWTNTNDVSVVLTKSDTKWSLGSIIYPYTKAIAQAKVELIPQVEILETTVEDILSIQSERGEGMLGSSMK